MSEIGGIRHSGLLASWHQKWSPSGLSFLICCSPTCSSVSLRTHLEQAGDEIRGMCACHGLHHIGGLGQQLKEVPVGVHARPWQHKMRQMLRNCISHLCTSSIAAVFPFVPVSRSTVGGTYTHCQTHDTKNLTKGEDQMKKEEKRLCAEGTASSLWSKHFDIRS